MLLFIPITIILGDRYGHFWCLKPVIWQAWCIHFGTLWRSRGTWEHTNGHLGVQTWIFTDLGGFRVPILIACRVPWAKNSSFCSCLFPCHFFQSESGRLELWWYYGTYLMTQGHFFCILRVLEAGLKFDDFWWLSWGGRAERTHPLEGLTHFRERPPTTACLQNLKL